MSIDIKKSYWLFTKIHSFIKKLLTESEIIILKNRFAFFKFLSHKNISVYMLHTQVYILIHAQNLTCWQDIVK